jgi:hypothetical protein
MEVSGGSRVIATPFPSAPPVMRNSIGLASLPSGPPSASTLSTWLYGCGLYRPMSRPESALSSARDNGSIWRMRSAEKNTIPTSGIRSSRPRINWNSLRTIWHPFVAPGETSTHGGLTYGHLKLHPDLYLLDGRNPEWRPQIGSTALRTSPTSIAWTGSPPNCG